MEALTLEGAYEKGKERGKMFGPPTGSTFILPEEHLEMDAESELSNYSFDRSQLPEYIRRYCEGYNDGSREYTDSGDTNPS